MRSADFKELNQKLQELDITIFKNENDGFTVFTTCEPLFCYVRKTQDEISEAVKETLSSYIRTFYHVKDVNVIAQHEQIEASLVPAQYVVPISKLRASIRRYYTCRTHGNTSLTH